MSDRPAILVLDLGCPFPPLEFRWLSYVCVGTQSDGRNIRQTRNLHLGGIFRHGAGHVVVRFFFV
jgi:hypothetical protein